MSAATSASNFTPASLISNFSENAMGRFPQLEQRLQSGSKGLRLVVQHITAVSKEVDTFRKSLFKTRAPLAQYLAQKSANDSLGVAIRAVAKGLEDSCATMENACMTYQTDVIEPFSVFAEHYEQCNKAFLKEAGKIIAGLEISRTKVTKSKEQYGRTAKALANSPPDENSEACQACRKARGDYQTIIERHNAMLLEKQAEYRKQLELVERNEETRTNVIAKSMMKFTGLTEQLLKDHLASTAGMTQTLIAINPISDLNLFVAELARKPKTETFARIVFEDRGDVYQQLTAQKENPSRPFPEFEVISADEGHLEKPLVLDAKDQDFLKATVQTLLAGNEINQKDKVHVSELFSAEAGRTRFAKTLSQLVTTNKLTISNYAAFEALGELSNTLLTNMSVQHSRDPFILWTVLTASFLISSTKVEEDGAKRAVALRELTSSSSIWCNKDYWISAIQYRLERTLSRVKPAGEESKDSGLRKSVVFADLCTLAVQMALMTIGRDLGRDLLIQFASYYKIDSQKLNQLLSDYEGAQPLSRDTHLTAKEVRGVLVSRAGKTAKRFEGKACAKLATIFRLSLGYISDLRTFSYLLLLNHELSQLLRKPVHKQVLRLPALSPKVGFRLWNVAINDPKLRETYQEIKAAKLDAYRTANNGACEIIKLDVFRSFHSWSEAVQDSIMNVLRCYAIYDPVVEYCQGMNFIAGLFYFVYQDEAEAFSMFASLISKLKLADFYKQDVPLLDMHIYLLNRLIAIYLPHLHTHLYEEGINATYFCSPWFLTSFAYVLQYCPKGQIPPLLLAIFDKYIYVTTALTPL